MDDEKQDIRHVTKIFGQINKIYKKIQNIKKYKKLIGYHNSISILFNYLVIFIYYPSPNFKYFTLSGSDSYNFFINSLHYFE